MSYFSKSSNSKNSVKKYNNVRFGSSMYKTGSVRMLTSRVKLNGYEGSVSSLKKYGYSRSKLR